MRFLLINPTISVTLVIKQPHFYLNISLQDMPACTSLEEVVKTVKPSALIGAAAQPKTFTKEIIEEMSRNNERPVSK